MRIMCGVCIYNASVKSSVCNASLVTCVVRHRFEGSSHKQEPTETWNELMREETIKHGINGADDLSEDKTISTRVCV